MRYTGTALNDPEMRYTPRGQAVTTFAVLLPSDGPEPLPPLRCVAWNRIAELAADTLRKGDTVMVSGYPKTRTWFSSLDGENHSVEEFVLFTFVKEPS